MVPDLLTQFGGPTCTNGNATTTCPPTQGQISERLDLHRAGGRVRPGRAHGGRPRRLPHGQPEVADPDQAVQQRGACGATIPAGTAVKLTGVRFPCKTIQPDDPAVTGHQGACLTA